MAVTAGLHTRQEEQAMGNLNWITALREQDTYHQAAAMLKAIEEHKQAIARLENSLATLGDIADLARVDRMAVRLQVQERLSKAT